MLRLSHRFYDSLVKLDVRNGGLERRWTGGADVYVTEADFVPRPEGGTEDDGVLVSVVYNSTAVFCVRMLTCGGTACHCIHTCGCTASVFDANSLESPKVPKSQPQQMAP